MSCPVDPEAIVEVVGVRVIVVRTGVTTTGGGFTVTSVVPLTAPAVAVIVPVPAEIPVTIPDPSTVTVPALSDVQVIVGAGVIVPPL